eukprot:TRINITY_DN945_c0_g2_i1.p1 TRINITY_DN945_c0_g2~~TRINITY_DN945_c0_g2_i1.p1  ORF type:complete len:376 (-),score=88.17 TRINITY_DN945_c0_g2_i1:744-1793(-)
MATPTPTGSNMSLARPPTPPANQYYSTPSYAVRNLTRESVVALSPARVASASNLTSPSAVAAAGTTNPVAGVSPVHNARLQDLRRLSLNLASSVYRSATPPIAASASSATPPPPSSSQHSTASAASPGTAAGAQSLAGASQWNSFSFKMRNKAPEQAAPASPVHSQLQQQQQFASIAESIASIPQESALPTPIALPPVMPLPQTPQRAGSVGGAGQTSPRSQISSTSASSTKPGPCRVCNARPVDCMVIPCTHRAMCLKCARDRKKCVLCERPIEQRVPSQFYDRSSSADRDGTRCSMGRSHNTHFLRSRAHFKHIALCVHGITIQSTGRALHTRHGPGFVLLADVLEI